MLGCAESQQSSGSDCMHLEALRVMGTNAEGGGPDERGRVFELPTDDGVPLVQAQRQVAVGADPLGVEGVHRRFTGGPDGQRLLQIRFTAASDPRHLHTHTLPSITRSWSCP